MPYTVVVHSDSNPLLVANVLAPVFVSSTILVAQAACTHWSCNSNDHLALLKGRMLPVAEMKQTFPQQLFKARGVIGAKKSPLWSTQRYQAQASTLQRGQRDQEQISTGSE